MVSIATLPSEETDENLHAKQNAQTINILEKA
jgi:hypothetical protein